MEQSDLVSVFAKDTTANQRDGDRPLGSILVEAGRLTLGQLERILQFQSERGMKFGDAAIKLRLLKRKDIDFALARQFGYPLLVSGQGKVSKVVEAAYEISGPKVEAFRTLRSQLTLRWFDRDPVRPALAVVSAARREGRSFIAANLAVVFSQLGERTLLIDADLRNPQQHEYFGLDNSVGLSKVLAGRAGPEAIQRIPSLPHLSVLPAGGVPPNPLELLSRPTMPELLDQLASQLDVILLDTPAAAETADASMLAVRAGAALIVARKNTTRMWRVQGISDSVAESRATIVGAVLNDF